MTGPSPPPSPSLACSAPGRPQPQPGPRGSGWGPRAEPLQLQTSASPRSLPLHCSSVSSSSWPLTVTRVGEACRPLSPQPLPSKVKGERGKESQEGRERVK